MSNVPNPDSTAATRPPTRVTTIVWGGILLLVAAVAATTTFLDPLEYTSSFFVWSVVGFGGLLVIAGIIGAIVRASTGRTAEPSASGDNSTANANDLFGR